MAVEPPDPEYIRSWQEGLDRFDKYFWPLFQSRGYSKEAAYLYWSLHQIASSLEELPIILADAQDHRPPDDGEEWKQS